MLLKIFQPSWNYDLSDWKTVSEFIYFFQHFENPKDINVHQIGNTWKKMANVS